MARVVALYRYPLKGFTPQSCDELVVVPSSRVAGDRVLNLRFADAPVADEAWCRKYHGVVLANTPGLALLRTTFDAEQSRLKIALGDRTLVDEPLSDAGRARIVRLATEDPRLTDVHQLRTRASGPYVHIQMHVALDPQLTLEAAHAAVVAAEKRILAAFPAADIIIHADPRGRAEPHGGAFSEASVTQ